MEKLLDQARELDDPSYLTRVSRRLQELHELSYEAQMILEDAVVCPFKPLTDRYRHCRNEYQGNKAKNELVEFGYAVDRHIRAKPLKRKLLQITNKGREFIRTNDRISWQPRKGRGGIVHRFWQHHIQDLFEKQGWQANLENRGADVSLANGNTEYAVEVAMKNRPREIEHVRKHLVGFDEILIAARTDDVRDGLRQRLDENGLLNDRVTVRLLRQFTDTEQLPIK